MECGFLSNQSEAELLNEETYQDKVAYAVMMGILRYLAKPWWFRNFICSGDTFTLEEAWKEIDKISKSHLDLFTFFDYDKEK